MWKKIIAIFLAVIIVIGAAVGGGIYAFAESAKPKFDEKNLAESAKIDKEAKALTDFSKVTAFKFEKGESVVLDFGKEVTFNTAVFEERGDNVLKFRLYKEASGKWEMFYEQDRILEYRLCSFEPVKTSKLRIEMTDCIDAVSIKNLEIYNLPKSDTPTKVSQYLVLGSEGEMAKIRDSHDEGFSGFYDVVTDVIIIGEIYIDENSQVQFFNGEKVFADNLQAFKDILGDRSVRIWTTVRFDQPETDGESSLDRTKMFINENVDAVVENIKKMTDKYGVYGVDYDWEYPQNMSQWSAYNKIIKKTAEKVKVSVAIAPWGSKLSVSAIKCIEHVNVMAYDMFDERGDHANINVGGIESIRKMMFFGYKKEQILMGIPTYGRTTDRSINAWPVAAGSEKELGEFNSIIKDYAYQDENGKDVTCDGYIQSYAEARDKTRLAQESGIGGIMIFRAKCDSPYTYEHSIHRAVKSGIEACEE